jgi:hypothetical protein
MIAIVQKNIEIFNLLLPLSIETLNERNENYHSALHLVCINVKCYQAGQDAEEEEENDKEKEEDGDGDDDDERQNEEEQKSNNSQISLQMCAALLSQDTIQLGIMDIEGKSPFHLACESGIFLVAEMLLQCCKKKHDASYVELFLNHPVATIIDGNDEGFKQLQQLIQTQDTDFVVEVKTSGGVCSSLLDMVYVHMVVPTLRASWIVTGTRSAQAQKGKKIKIDEKRFEKFADYSRVPLHLAFLNGHADIVEMLMAEKQINCNAIDKAGNNCAHFAAMSRNMVFFTETTKFFNQIKYLCLDSDHRAEIQFCTKHQ